MNKHAQSKLRLTAMILCCGIGLSSVGIKKAGFHILGAVDIWEYAKRIYQLNFPDTPFLQENLRKLTVKRLIEEFKIPTGLIIDLIQISNPCTGISRSGLQQIFSAVNSLFFPAIALAFKLSARTIVFENVASLNDKNCHVLFGMVMEFVKRQADGYDVQAVILNSYLYGDPQARERIFIICTKKELRFNPIPSPVAADKRRTIADVIPDAEYLVNHEHGERLYLPTECAPTVTGHAHFTTYNGETTRSLIPREYASLMGLPETFKLEGSVSNQILGVGNGVCVNTMAAIATEISNNINNN
jgi:DNA (cytosine-5)-methyltransferase 1